MWNHATKQLTFILSTWKNDQQIFVLSSTSGILVYIVPYIEMRLRFLGSRNLKVVVDINLLLIKDICHEFYQYEIKFFPIANTVYCVYLLPNLENSFIVIYKKISEILIYCGFILMDLNYYK
jgi:hypothetical protein